MVLEGPPGTGKSTLLRAVADELGIGFEFVEGNAELTPARLVGHFDPARVLTDGYAPDVFVDGPLVAAMRDGSLLYVEEINRIPEETLNVLITVMSEHELHVRGSAGSCAEPGFRLVAAMNPFDAVGTARISSAVYDRVCRLSVTTSRPPTRWRSSATLDRRRHPITDWLAKVVEVVRLHAHTSRRARRLVGSRGDRHRRRRSLVAHVASTRRRRRSTSASTAPSWRCPVGFGCAKACREPPRTSSPNCGIRCSACERWREPSGKAAAPTGATPLRAR